jgi:SAM-dependent methyltransferase
MVETAIREDVCLLTGRFGRRLRTRSPQEVIAWYQRYLGQPLPAHLATKYCTETVSEYQCDVSGLRWYAPARMADADLYEWLGATFDWYYEGNTWDFATALALLKKYGARSFVEPGCGGGRFLSAARQAGMRGVGIEINDAALRSCRAAGLEVLHATEAERVSLRPDALVALQSLEHVNDPIGWLDDYLKRFPARTLILSAPCHESLLGYTSDPLSWPPHHATAWSRKAYETLARLLGYRLVEVHYDGLKYGRFCKMAKQEPGERFEGLDVPRNGLGRWLIFHKRRWQGALWGRSRHSILGVFRK